MDLKDLERLELNKLAAKPDADARSQLSAARAPSQLSAASRAPAGDSRSSMSVSRSVALTAVSSCVSSTSSAARKIEMLTKKVEEVRARSYPLVTLPGAGR